MSHASALLSSLRRSAIDDAPAETSGFVCRDGASLSPVVANALMLGKHAALLTAQETDGRIKTPSNIYSLSDAASANTTRHHKSPRVSRTRQRGGASGRSSFYLPAVGG